MLTQTLSQADAVDLTTGRTLHGIIEEETPEHVAILTRGQNRISVPRSQVTGIRREGRAENAMLMGNLLLEDGMLWDAAGSYSEALDAGLAPQRLVEHLVRIPTALVTMVENQPDPQGIEIRNFLLSLLSQVEPTDEVLHLAGRLCQATGDQARARDAYEQVNPSWWIAHPDKAQDVAQFYVAQARGALEDDDFDGVIEAMRQLTVLDLELASQLRPIFLIQLANSQAEQGRWGDAITIVGQMVHPLAPEIARTYLESLFLELENRPTTPGDLLSVMPVFEQHYRTYFPEDADERIANLQWRIGESLQSAGDFVGARRAFNAHYDIADPDTLVRERVLAASILEELSLLEPDDWDSRVRLTIDLIDNELWAEALDQCERLADAPDRRIRTFGAQQRHAIQLRLAQERLAEAFDLYDAGDFSAAMDRLEENSGLLYAARLGDEVNQLRTLCQQRMNEEPNRRATLAWNQYQQAERHFVIGEYPEAIALLEPMIRQFPETQAAAQGEVMLQTAHLYQRARHPRRGDIRPVAPEAATPELTPEEATRRELEEMFDLIEEELGNVP